MQIFDTPDQIRAFQLLAVKSALRLESLGMRHSSGRSIKAHWAKQYGLPPRCKTETLIARIDAELAEIKSRIDATKAGAGHA